MVIMTTRKEIRKAVENGATNVTYYTLEDYNKLVKKEGVLDYIAYSEGRYGVNGAMFRGRKTGKFYGITDKSRALYLFT